MSNWLKRRKIKLAPSVRLKPIDSQDRIEALREQVDELDRSLLAILESRLALSRGLGALKRAQGIPLRDRSREAQVLANLMEQSQDEDLRAYLKEIYQSISACCLTAQSTADQLEEVAQLEADGSEARVFSEELEAEEFEEEGFDDELTLDGEYDEEEMSALHPEGLGGGEHVPEMEGRASRDDTTHEPLDDPSTDMELGLSENAEHGAFSFTRRMRFRRRRQAEDSVSRTRSAPLSSRDRGWLVGIPIAHRGLHCAQALIPENSLAAFRRAAEAGYGIELDVHLSADGVPIVFHDEELERMTGVEAHLSELTGAELSALKLIPSRETIPTLREALMEIAGRVPVLVEIKNYGTPVGLLEEAVALLIDEYMNTGAHQVCVQSFNPMSMKWFLKHRPHIIRGLISYSFPVEEVQLPASTRFLLRNLLFSPLCKPHYIAYEHQDIGRFKLRRLHRMRAKGTPIIVWTVRTNDAARVAQMRADNYIFEEITPQITPKGLLDERVDLEEVERDSDESTSKETPLIYTHNPMFPMTFCQLIFKGGACVDALGVPAARLLCQRQLLHGTQKKSRAVFLEAVEGLGTQLHLLTKSYAFGLSFTALTRNLQPLFSLLEEALTQPGLNHEEIAHTQRAFSAELESKWDHDGALAWSWLWRRLTRDHPMWTWASVTPAQVMSLDVEEIASHWAELHARERLLSCVSSDALKPTLSPLFEQLSARLPSSPTLSVRGSGRTHLQHMPPLPELNAPRLTLVHKPGRQQAQVFIAHRVIPRDHPHRHALKLAVCALGGTFSSPLMQEVRVKRGLSYGASATLIDEGACAFFSLNATPDLNDVAQTVAVMREVLRRASDGGLTHQEIQFARDYMINAHPFRIETPAMRAALVAQSTLLNIDPQESLQLDLVYRALEDEHAREAAARYLTADLIDVLILTDITQLGAQRAELEREVAVAEVIDADAPPETLRPSSVDLILQR
jgi:glycerophosphoryl diester phosphodiesterase/predicted Zn-dependent peptidase/chorismate mutase